MLPQDGTLQLATTPLYTVPDGRAANICSIVLVNRHSVAVQLNLYVRTSGTLRRISPVNVYLGLECEAVEDTPIRLAPGDSIEGDCSVAEVVDFTVYGEEMWSAFNET